MSSETPIIHTKSLSRRFGNIRAVDGVDFAVDEGGIMALVGDNGAGKSTLIKMLCGVLEPSDGDIYLRGEKVVFNDYNEARKAGIETVYQELALAESQSVAANVFLGNEPLRDNPISQFLGLVDEKEMIERAREALNQVQIPVDPEAKVANLSGGQQQAVAIARALQSDPEILIMDEPTSALSIEGARNVLDVIRNLREQGLTIILISHNIKLVLSTADRISVLAQGRLMGVRDADTTDRQEIVSMMMGVEDTEEALALDEESAADESAA